MKSIILYTALFVSLILGSCSGTKHLADGESLYVGSKTKVQKEKGKKKFKVKKGSTKVTDAYLTVWDLPNGSIFGLPFLRGVPMRLMIYSAFYKEKKEGFSYWMRNNFGEEPVLLSDVNPELKAQKLVENFEKHGHFGTTADYSIKYKKNGKKAFVTYSLQIAPAYHYKSVEFIFDENQDSIKAVLASSFPSLALKAGDEFNFELLKEEKKNVWLALQENGFYHINESDILIEADTTVGNRQVDLRFRLNSNLTPAKLSKVYIGDVRVFMDSMEIDFFADKKIRYPQGNLKSDFLYSLITVKTNAPYSNIKTKQTSGFLSRTRIFNSQTITYEIDPTDSTKLVAKVCMTPAKATKIGVSVNANYTTSGYMGPSVELKLGQLNLLGKAQNLNMKINAFYDFPLGLYRERISRAYGLTYTGIYEAPLNWAIRHHKRGRETLPKYFVKANLDFIDRADYFQQIGVNGTFGFNWSTTKFDQHKLNVLDVVASDLRKTTDRFDSLLIASPLLGTSLLRQFIVSSSYAYTLDKRTGANWPRGLYFETKLETAGNALNLINVIINDKPNGQKTAVGLRFAQYVQLQYDFRYFMKTGRSSLLAFRTLGSVGYAYGNSDNMPYIRQYYIGGTNSLRPLSARSVGPGRFQQFESGEVNQVGDLKFEANLEYRFKLFYKLSGALWSDAGNVWLLKEDPNRPGSGVRWDKLIRDSYLTAGAGIRLDLNVLILRFDYGALLYVPYLEDGERWIWNHDKPFLGAAIGLGYPF